MACSEIPAYRSRNDYGCEEKSYAIAPDSVKTPSKIRDIKLQQLDYGYILSVGCKNIALDSPEKILYALKQYLKDPSGTENKFLNGELKFEK